MASPTDPLIGRTVAHYEITAKLGGGGMGVVYKARDTKLGRTVALKFLPRQWSHDEGARQRFLREAQAASAANHRSICTIHDIVQTDDEQFFIVMAYYEGPTLKQRLEGGALPLEEALEIATEIAEGLTKAHAQGVVHRDIKPGNLMLTDDGVKILDFGLAKFATALQLTLPGSTVGTVAYMSPEQARGEEADELSDVWAVGVVSYQMLTGEVPFNGTHSEAIFYAIKNEPTPPLSTPERAIPESVERIVSLALQKDRANRYQSARELARDLRMIQGRSVPLDLRTAPLPPVPTRELSKPRPRWRRVLTPARASAAAVVLLAAAGGSYWWVARPVDRIPVAIAPVANHTGEPELDGYRLAMTETLVDELSESPNIRVAPYLRTLEMVRRFITGGGDISSREAVQAISTQSGARFIVVPALAYRDGAWLAEGEIRSVDTGTNVGTFQTEAVTSSLPKETAYRLMAALAAGVQGHFKASWPRRAPAGRAAGARFRSLDAARAFEEGLNNYEQMEYSAALAALRRAAGEDPERAIAHAWLSRVLLLMGQGSEAQAAGRRASQLLSADTPQADALFASATLAESQADVVAAEARYRELTALQPDSVMTQTELADFLKRQNRNQQAVEAYHAALSLDPGYVRVHVDLCQLYGRLDDYPLAEKHAQTAIDAAREIGHRSGEAQALMCLGDSLLQQGNRLPEARQHVESARDILASLSHIYGLARVYQYLGLAAARERDYPTAVRAFEEALARSRQIGNRQLEGLELMNIGVSHERMGRIVEAAKYYQRSRDVYQDIGDERRAAEQEYNAANLEVNYGGDQADAVRRLANARATLKKLGYVDFEVVAIQAQATSLAYRGRHSEAVRLLREAVSISTERHLEHYAAPLNTDLARSHFLTNAYEQARDLLEKIVQADGGNLNARIALGRVHVRLGNFSAATEALRKALTDVEASRQAALVPLAHFALGEDAFESGNLQEAREHFARAASSWTANVPDAASVEAGCYQGSLDALAGQRSATAMVEAGIERSRKMGRLYVEARCRLHLARIHATEGRYGEALAALSEIRPDGDGTIGPELQAEVEYWRSRALAGRGDRQAADSALMLARKLVEQIRGSLTEPPRKSFASRATIRSILE